MSNFSVRLVPGLSIMWDQVCDFIEFVSIEKKTLFTRKPMSHCSATMWCAQVECAKLPSIQHLFTNILNDTSLVDIVPVVTQVKDRELSKFSVMDRSQFPFQDIATSTKKPRHRKAAISVYQIWFRRTHSQTFLSWFQCTWDHCQCR